MTLRLLIYLGYYALNLFAMKDGLAFFLTLPMMALVVYNIATLRDRYFTIDDIIHFLFYLSFVIEPIQMLDHGKIGEHGPVSATFYFRGDIIAAAITAFLFYGGYTLVVKMKQVPRPKLEAFRIDPNYALIVLTVATACFAIDVYLTGGISAVLAPRYERMAAKGQDAGDLTTVITTALVGVMSMSTVVLATFVRRRLSFALPVFLAALTMTAIVFNPFNAARFGLLSAYVPLAMVAISGRMRATYFYVAAMVGILVLFPILNISTRFGLAGFSEHSDTLFSDALSLQFLDIFDMLVECVHFTAIHGHTWGTKLLADLVVLYPRAWWAGKPTLAGLDVGNGVYLAHLYGTANLSQSVAGDAYMDFGYAGACAIGLLVGWLFHALLFSRRRLLNGHDLLSYAMIANLPILFRGPVGAVIITIFMQSMTLLAMRILMAHRTEVPAGTYTAGLGIGNVRARWRRSHPRTRPVDLASMRPAPSRP